MRDWSTEERIAVERKILDVLQGVGDTSAEHWQLGSAALHYRRPMTIREALKLPPPSRTTPAENQAAWARLYALEALGRVRESDVEETHRTE